MTVVAGDDIFLPEHLGQGFAVVQIAALAAPLGALLLLLTSDHRRRHDQMDMRVIIYLARVGIQHRDGTGRAPQLLVVPGERAHSLPATTYKRGRR